MFQHSETMNLQCSYFSENDADLGFTAASRFTYLYLTDKPRLPASATLVLRGESFP